MRILMISGDAEILDSNSATGKRTDDYRRVLGEIDILLCSSSIKSFIVGLERGRVLLSRTNFDFITAQSPEHWFLGWLLARFFHIPWQAQVHTDIFSPYFYRESLKNKLRVWLAKFILPKADSIRVVSERIKQSLKAQSSKLKAQIVVLPIFVDAKKIQSAKIKLDLRQKYSDYDFRILMASRLTYEKNIGLAIEAMAGVIQKYPKALLVIIGDGPEQNKLKVQIEKLKINAVFEPWTDDLASYYKTADLFLLTSNYEGYGRTVVEAMAAGLPVVMTDVGLAGELLVDDLDGRVTPVGDLLKLQQVIIELLEHEDKRRALSEESQKIAASLPSKEEYLRLYKEAMELVVK